MRVIVAAALAAAVALPAMAQEAPMPMHSPLAGTVLDVSSEAHVSRVPDLATIQAGVVTQSGTAAAAMADNNVRMNRVLAALRKAGIAERDITTSSLSLAPQYRYEQNQPPVITGYQASNQVTVRFRDLARAGTILDTLVAQGANSIDGPNLSVANPDAALDEARTAAVAKARARAELYARAAGLQVDHILSISESGTPVRPVPVMMARAAAVAESVPIAPGEQELGVTLSVRFLLK